MSHTFIHKPISILLGLTIAFAEVSSARAADGSLDPTFGNGGIVTTDFSGLDDQGMDVEVQPDGKIIVAGTSWNTNSAQNDFALARYNPDGSLDTAFGEEGKVSTDIANSDNLASAVSLQADGKIVVAGSAYNGHDTDFALARYNPDGTLDTSFDMDGKVSTVIGNSNDHAIDAALQPDGKILMTGFSFDDATSNYSIVLARFTDNGSLDTAFGSSGKVILSLDCSASGHAIALQPDGKILVAGDRCGDFALVRLNSDGSPDATFGSDGYLTTDFDNSYDSAYAVALQPDGKIVLAGQSNNEPMFSLMFALARYNSDGSLDITFDEDGRVTTDLGGWRDFGHALAIQPDGRILVVGEQWHEDGTVDFALARYKSDGSLDPAFDADGIVVTDISSGDYPTAVALQSDGGILVTGFSHTALNFDFDFVLARYDTAGSAIEVTLDVRPGKFPNRIELEKNVCKDDDNLPVAILTTPEFDALRLVDATSLQMGDPALGGTAAPIHSQGRDIDRDGDRDVWLLFALCDLVTNGALNQNTTELVLNGMTLDGIAFTARDSVEIIGHKPPQPIVPVFDYPVDEQVLDYEGSYLFRVQPIPAAEGFLWGFFQNGVMVWENYRDEGVLSGNEYGIHPGTLAHSKFVPGPVEVWVRASIKGQWTDAAVITIHLQSVGGQVTIDIKPGSQANHVNPKSRGRIHVAILSTPEFDALALIDRTTLRFGRTGAEESLHSCKEKGSDVNRDGLQDLICVFSIRATGFQEGDEIGILTAQTVDGIAIIGQDSIRVVREDD